GWEPRWSTTCRPRRCGPGSRRGGSADALEGLGNEERSTPRGSAGYPQPRLHLRAPQHVAVAASGVLRPSGRAGAAPWPGLLARRGALLARPPAPRSFEGWSFRARAGALDRASGPQWLLIVRFARRMRRRDCGMVWGLDSPCFRGCGRTLT